MTEDNSAEMDSDVRSETVTINVPKRIRDAMERLVEKRKAAGEARWSINREGWERLSYTFDLTGLDETIEQHATDLGVNKERDVVLRHLERLVFEETSIAPKFEPLLPGKPWQMGRVRDAGIANWLASGAGLQAMMTGDYHVVDNSEALRADNRRAVDKLTLNTDAPITDPQLQDINLMGGDAGHQALRTLLGDLAARVKSLDLSDRPIVVQKRLLTRLFDEWHALRECLIVNALADYNDRWHNIRDRAVEKILTRQDQENLAALPEEEFIEAMREYAKPAAAELDAAFALLDERLVGDEALVSVIGAMIKDSSEGVETFWLPQGYVSRLSDDE